MKRTTLLRIIGPGILLAATGVGAGDLATTSLAGAHVGLVVLWAVLLGAFLKFVLNEGLTRWQLATGTTLLEGSIEHLGQWLRWLLLVYLAVWSFLLGAALMSAVGVTCHAIYPLARQGADAAQWDKVVYGMTHSLLAVLLVEFGGYRVFERVMSFCIGMMFVVAMVTAAALRPNLGQFARGLLLPAIPLGMEGGVGWSVAVLGGVGGTVTLLCYGYWIREEGREKIEMLQLCRVDLAIGYAMTAAFGLAMVVIGSSLEALSGGGANLMVNIADRLEQAFGRQGPLAKWAFLIGAWGAVFSSLFGVWQSIPYLFADLWSLRHARTGQPQQRRMDTKAWPYRVYLCAMAVVPVTGLIAIEFQTIQKTYAVVGAMFVPLLSAVLLVLNGRPDWVGRHHVNSRPTAFVLAGTLLFFLSTAILKVYLR